jgi:N-acetylneuraminic acid mutarotase
MARATLWPLIVVVGLGGCVDYSELSRCYRPPGRSRAPDGPLATAPPFWIQLHRSAFAHEGAGAAADETGVYAIAGTGSGLAPIKTVERYSIATNTWTTVGSLDAERSNLSAATDWTGQITLVGGVVAKADVGTAEVYDPRQDRWNSIAPMPTARSALAATFDSCGRLLAIGGTAANAPVPTVEAYTPATATWSSLPGLSTPRFALAAAADSSGRVYALGGTDPSAQEKDIAEVFSVASNAWQRIAPMSSARSGLAAVFAPDGRLYAIAGNAGEPTAEAYTPSTNEWAPLARLCAFCQRARIGATVGWDGRVYVLGGSNGNASDALQAYGPSLSLSVSTGTAGTRPTLKGQNFAAQATVSVFWSSEDGTLLGTQPTDPDGVMGELSFAVPSVAPGSYFIVAVDDRAQYPVRAPFTVTR